MGRLRFAALVLLVLASDAAAAPVSTVNPSTLAFGAVDVGDTTAGQTLTVTNTGDMPLVINAAYLFTGATEYTVTGTTGTSITITLQPTEAATWTFACAPTAAGPRNGTFRITSNHNNVPSTSQDVGLTCLGQRGTLVFAPAAYDFLGVPEGNTRSQMFTLTNNGNVPVTNVTVAFSGTGTGYSLTAPTFPIPSIAAGASVMVTAMFAPLDGTYGGTRVATVTGSWGSAKTATATLTLNGDGLTTGFDTSPSSPNPLDFGDVRFDQTKTMSVAVINTSGTAYQVRSLSITLGTAMAGELTVSRCTKNNVQIACPTMAAPYNSSGLNDTLVVEVRVDPNNRVALLDGTLTVGTDLAVNGTRTVPLKANSVSAMVALDPSSMMLDFGATDLDAVPVAVTRTITLTNNGVAQLDVGTPTTMTTRFTFSGLAGAFSLPPGGTKTIQVTYTPLVEKPPNQPDIASLVFPISGVYGGPSAIAISISGYGADRHISVSPAPEFPDTYKNPGSLAPVLPVTITNTGYAPLDITAVMLTDAPIWTLVNPDPVIVPGNSTYDFNVRFAPVAGGKAPNGQLTIFNNDNGLPMVALDLVGNGLDRNVTMGPAEIDFGYVATGGVTRLSDIAPSVQLEVASAESTNQILLREIDVLDAAFTIVDGSGDVPANMQLSPGTVQRFDILFAPDRDGPYETTASLFLDEDHEVQTVVTLRGHAATIDARGGGGCATGRGHGLGVLLVLALLFVIRRRGAVVALALIALPARADDIDTETFRPTPATGAVAFQLEPAGVGAEGAWVAVATMSYASNSLALVATDRDVVISDDRPVTRRAGLELGGAYAFLDRFEAGLRVPLFSQAGDSPSMGAFHVPAADGTALGDITLHARAQLLARTRLVVGTSAHITLPTSTDDQFVGLDAPSLRLLALASVEAAPKLTLAFNAGGALRQRAEYRNDAGIVRITQGSGALWGAAAIYAASARMRISAEAFGQINSGGAGPMDDVTAPVDGLLGFRYDLGRMTIGLAVGRGITSAFGTPDVRGVLALAMHPGKPEPRPRTIIDPDRDGDRIVDRVDSCPDEREDRLGNATDGCPLVDADRDGIADAQDRCPTEGEDKDAFEDDDGCPDPDDDHDTIADAQDKCPDTAEVINGVADDDGCPDQAETTTTVTTGGNVSALQAAEETFMQGRKLFKEKKYDKACAAFEMSQRLDPQAGTQFNLATCYVELGKLATAWNLFRELGRSDKDSARRAEANKLAAKIAPRVPKLQVVLGKQVAGVSVFMNNVDASAVLGLETPVDVGTYELVAGAPGHLPWRKTVVIKDPGSVTKIVIELQPTP